MDITTILDDVVRQFSDPLAFYRELVQNAIDAGTGEVDITVHYNDDTGQAEVQVCDAGEGMNREIIQGRLLRLFSSCKDDDLTKIGRFGIGFVSVFAIEPDLVVVETGRSGEYWRILFDPDRSYELYALDHPREGTTVTILKSMTPEAFHNFFHRSRLVARSWCLHASVPIYWMGEDLREPFAIDSLVTCAHTEQGTRIVMGLTRDLRGRADYFNRGLTLKADAESPWPHVSFKIDSRYLEHTLTRDQLIEDEHFQRAMERLEGLATQRIPEELLDRLEESARSVDDGHHEPLCQHLLNLVHHGPTPPADWRARATLRTVGGDPLSIDDLQSALREGREAYFLRRPSSLQRLVPDAIFLAGRRAGPVGALLNEALESAPAQLEERWLVPTELKDAHPDISQTMHSLLKATRAEAPRVLLCNLSVLGDVTAHHLGLIVPDTASPVDLHESITPPSLPALRADQVLLVDLSRAEIARAAALASQEPELAAITLFRLLIPPHNSEIADELDRLTLVAMQTRQDASR